jgi:hypothetical protein
MGQCNDALLNTGGGICELKMSEIKRLLFVARYKEDGSKNTISQSNAALLAQWQTLFNKKGFASDVLTKVVPSPVVYGLKSEQGDQKVFDENGYFQKLADGDYNIPFMMYNVDPVVIKSLKALEKLVISVYLVDADTRVWGVRNSTNLDPFEVLNIAVGNPGLASLERPSDENITFRLKDPSQLLDMMSVQLATGDVMSDSDFYGMIDGTATVTSPATTGCVLKVDTDAAWGADAITGIAYNKINFYDNTAPTVAIPVAIGEWAESPAGTYTVTKTGIFTTAHVYLAKFTHDKYDIDAATVTVP